MMKNGIPSPCIAFQLAKKITDNFMHFKEGYILLYYVKLENKNKKINTK
jgi:hypothetical protein